MGQVMGIGQSGPILKKEEMVPCPDHWEGALFETKRRAGTGERKMRNTVILHNQYLFYSGLNYIPLLLATFRKCRSEIFSILSLHGVCCQDRLCAL
jgi:hypothetical protein